jgi:DNA replication and repair protein RecF
LDGNLNDPVEAGRTPAEAAGDSGPHVRSARLWVRSLTLTNFRNYAALSLEVDARPVVLIGSNGAGKTNLLEAVSLLAPGQGLRRAAYPDLARSDAIDATSGAAAGNWAIAATVIADDQPVAIGTGLQASSGAGSRTGRIVRIDGANQSGSGALADIVEMVWLTPASDGLFTGPAAERRRFLDRLILCFDPGYRTRAGQFERAMRQRNRLLDAGQRGAVQFEGLETIMAETGTAIAAARVEAVSALRGQMQCRRERQPDSLFPWADLGLEGTLEEALAHRPAVDVEDWYREELARYRERDRAAGRTLSGPHRSDLVVRHGPKAMPARICSTGEQKALLIGLVLSHAELAAERRYGQVPILLLDEIAAHLDAGRRAALFADLLRLGTQAWMTGTDRSAFADLENRARFCVVSDGGLREI